MLLARSALLAGANVRTIRFCFAMRGTVDVTPWDDLLHEFRALGGTADNIRLGEGEYGRGLFPVIPSLPVALHIPENLLIPVEDMVFIDGKLRVGPKSGASARERAWLDRYQELLGWSGGGADSIRQMYDQAAALPSELRSRLATEPFCAPLLAEPTDRLILTRYMTARSLTYEDKSVVIPLVELANHRDGVRYLCKDGVGLHGQFPGEILVQYSDHDSLDYFLTWGFASPRPVAFSVMMSGQIDTTPMQIQSGFAGRPASPRDWIPQMEKSAAGGSLSFVMLGNEKFPRLAKGIFYKLMRDAGYSGYEECFDLIQHHNRLHALALIKVLDGVDLPLARTLRAVAQHRLHAMSFCFGVREI